MKRAAPKPYENLLYAGYPRKNAASVNALACKRVKSDEAKKRMCDQINEQIWQTLDSETAQLAPMAQLALRTAVEKVVKKLVDEPVKSFLNSNKTQKQQPNHRIIKK